MWKLFLRGPYGWGDENTHGWETVNGYTITKDPSTNYWYYARRQTDLAQLKSAWAVGTAGATAGLVKHLRPEQVTKLRSYGSSNKSIGTQSSSDDAVLQSRSIQRTPVTGTRKIPVIMVNFSDAATTFDHTQFQSELFGTGTNSMKDYYEEVSYGFWRRDGRLYDPRSCGLRRHQNKRLRHPAGNALGRNSDRGRFRT
jgi:hypothetical protein